jgi:transcriptional regulator with XRE-family HTH domain
MHNDIMSHADSVGDLLREWRARRKLSQMMLAGEAEVSTRHLSFLESGRATASREMLIRLADQLDLTPRARNQLLLAGGYAPIHSEQSLNAPDMAAARSVVQRVLDGHALFPALAVDRLWHLVAANDPLSFLLEGVAPHLLESPVNVLRLSLHPDGLAPRILNLAEWRHHLLHRLRHDRDMSGDPALAALHAELSALPFATGQQPPRRPDGVAVPLIIRGDRDGPPLSFLSTTTVFGTAVDVTLAELTLECFYPADEATRTALLGPKES